MSKRATDDLLDALHGMTAAVLLEQLRQYQAGTMVDAEGRVLPVPSALIAAITKFLKDNGVDRAATPGGTLDLLKDELPELADNVVQFKR